MCSCSRDQGVPFNGAWREQGCHVDGGPPQGAPVGRKLEEKRMKQQRAHSKMNANVDREPWPCSGSQGLAGKGKGRAPRRRGNRRKCETPQRRRRILRTRRLVSSGCFLALSSPAPVPQGAPLPAQHAHWGLAGHLAQEYASACRCSDCAAAPACVSSRTTCLCCLACKCWLATDARGGRNACTHGC